MWQTQGYWTAQHGINLTSPCHTPLKLSCLPRQDSQVRPSRPPQAVYTAFPELAVRLFATPKAYHSQSRTRTLPRHQLCRSRRDSHPLRIIQYLNYEPPQKPTPRRGLKQCSWRTQSKPVPSTPVCSERVMGAFFVLFPTSFLFLLGSYMMAYCYASSAASLYWNSKAMRTIELQSGFHHW